MRPAAVRLGLVEAPLAPAHLKGPLTDQNVARELSSRTADFIRKYINSLEQLEILLLLRSSQERPQTADKVYEQIRSNPASVRSRLNQLVAQGLVRLVSDSELSYCYQPATPELAAAVEDLSVAYKEYRVAVIEHIFAEAPSPIQGFADAFRIRRDQNNG